MDDQCFTCDLFTSPLRQWSEYVTLVIAAAELEPTWKNSYHVESRGIPDIGEAIDPELYMESCLTFPRTRQDGFGPTVYPGTKLDTSSFPDSSEIIPYP
jgi:hypothetical protein